MVQRDSTTQELHADPRSREAIEWKTISWEKFYIQQALKVDVHESNVDELDFNSGQNMMYNVVLRYKCTIKILAS